MCVRQFSKQQTENTANISETTVIYRLAQNNVLVKKLFIYTLSVCNVKRNEHFLYCNHSSISQQAILEKRKRKKY